MTLQRVVSRRDLRTFHAVADRVYRRDPRWVPPVRQQVRRWWRGGVAMYVWRDRYGQALARTTLHTDPDLDAKLGRRCQLFGLTEFASAPAAEQLLAAVAGHGRRAGRELLFGPVALLPNQAGGVITSGFAHRGFVDSAYNPSWYPDAYEGCGFTRRFEADTWWCPVPAGDVWPNSPLPDRVAIHHGDPRRLDEQLTMLRGMLNASFAQRGYYTAISAAQLRAQTDGLAHLLDPALLLYLTVDGAPAAFVLCLPDISGFLSRTGGDLHPLHQLRLLATRHRYRREAVLIVKGTVPEQQGRGWQRLLAARLHRNLRERGYTALRSTFVERDNPASAAPFRAMGGSPLHGYTFYERAL